MALTKAQLIDLNANELIIDLDADTSITADTDDQIDIKIAGADDFRFTANTFTALSGSTIAAQALTATTITTTGAIAIANDGNIGSAGDADAIAISSSGVVTFSQSPVFPDGSLAVADLDIDGATDIGAGIADADLFIIDDGAGGTNRKVAASRIKTYIGASTAADDLTIGDAAVTLSTSSGNITIDATANDSDIIFKGTDNSADITMLTLDGSAAGDATFNNQVIVGDGKLVLNSTAVTSTAAELNLLDGVSGLVQADLTKLAAVDSTATELNIVDGGTTVGTTAVADGDGIVTNDGGTMRQTTVQTFATYFASEITAMSNLVTTGALDSGSITSGFGAIDNGTSNIRSATITAETAFVPDAANGASLGTTSLEFADLYLHDGAQILWGADQDVLLTHVADAGLSLKTSATGDDTKATLTLQTGETDIAQDDVLGAIDFQAPDEGTGTDAILVAAGIAAVSEGDFSSSNNATKLSFKTAASEAAAEKASLSSTGVFTATSFAGSGSGLTAGTTPLTTLDIDGATDIGAAIVDADLFIVDDGAGGTNRKVAASRLKTYIPGGVNTPIAIVKLSGTQTISHNTTTDVAFASETIDTASAFNTGNYTFTVPSGQAGIYQVSVNVRRSNFNASRFYLDIITGGGNFVLEHGDSGNGSNYNTVGGTIFTNLAESETIKIRVYHNVGGNGDLTADGTYLAIMKLIQ